MPPKKSKRSKRSAPKGKKAATPAAADKLTDASPASPAATATATATAANENNNETSQPSNWFSQAFGKNVPKDGWGASLRTAAAQSVQNTMKDFVGPAEQELNEAKKNLAAAEEGGDGEAVDKAKEAVEEALEEFQYRMGIAKSYGYEPAETKKK